MTHVRTFTASQGVVLPHGLVGGVDPARRAAEEPAPEDTAPPTAPVPAPAPAPEAEAEADGGRPTEDWTVARIDAWAKAPGLSFPDGLRKAEKLEPIDSTSGGDAA